MDALTPSPFSPSNRQPAPKKFDLHSAIQCSPEKLTHRQAVLIAIELLKAASPVLARHFDERENVLTGWEIALGNFRGDVVREAAIRMIRGLKGDTKDQIPDAPRLAWYCEWVLDDRAERAAVAAKAKEEAEHQAATPEAALRAKSEAIAKYPWLKNILGESKESA